MEDNHQITKNRKTIRYAIIQTITLMVLVGVGVILLFQLWTRNVLQQQTTILQNDLVRDVTVARNMIDPVIQDIRDGVLTQEQGEEEAREILRRMAYPSKYEDDYIFLVKFDGMVLVQPFSPEAEMVNAWDILDEQGKYPIRDLSYAAQANPDGSFIEYNFLSKITGLEEEKLSYMISVPELDAFMGIGTYTREIYEREEALVRQATAITIGTILLISIPMLLALYRVRKQHRLTEIEIRERHNAERSLFFSEERLKLALESSNEGWWDWNIKENRVFYSPRFYDLFGLSPNEGGISIYEILQFIHPQDKARAEEDLTLHLRGESQDYSSEYRLFAKDGGVRWIRSSGKVVAFDEGSPSRMVGTFADITETKQAAQAIVDSEASLRSIFNNTYDGLLVHNAAGKIFSCNQKMGDFVGLPMDGIINTSNVLESGWLHAVEGRDIEQLWAGVLDGETITFEGKVYNHITQTHLDVEITSVQTEWFGKNVVFSVIRDVSQQKMAEYALMSSQKKLRDVVDQLYEGLMLISETGQVLEWNPAMEYLTGILHQEAVGKQISELHLNFFNHLPDAGKYHEMLENLFKDGDLSQNSWIFNKPSEFHLQGSDGREKILMQTVFPVITENEFRIGATLVDVTEQKLFEARIQNELAKIDALRKIDSSIASHKPIDETVEVIFEQVRKMQDVDGICLMLIDEQTNTLQRAYSTGIEKLIEKCPIYHIEQNSSLEIIRSKDPVWYHVSNKPEKHSLCRCAQDCGFETFVAVPLQAEEKPIGLLEVFFREKFTPGKDWLDYFVTLAGQTAIALDSQRLYTGLQSTNQALIKSYESTIAGWSKALELKDKETKGHSDRVMHLACDLARKMGFTDEQMRHFRYGVFLHDIGKMGIPDSILLKPGPLSEEEWAVMRQHPVHAYQLLHGIEYLELSLEIPYGHHERWDGSGYPQGLKGEAIPLGARIFMVVDVWDALTSDRPYRKALSDKESLQYLVENAGKLFDPEVVKKFVELISL